MTTVRHMLPLVGLAGAVLAVHLPELVHVAGSPPAEEGQVVEPPWVLVQAHEGEESVQDLIVHLKPCVSLGLARQGTVQHPGHHHEEDGRRQRRPRRGSRHVHGVPDPFLGLVPQGEAQSIFFTKGTVKRRLEVEDDDGL